jgi:hypothetical protein
MIKLRRLMWLGKTNPKLIINFAKIQSLKKPPKTPNPQRGL